MANPEWKAKIARADLLFDLAALSLFFVHLFLSFYATYYHIIPSWILAVLLACTRTSMGAVGHYHVHRKKDGVKDWGEFLFDMQYVGAALVTYDGHVMLHHLHTNSSADSKRTVFTGLLGLPRIWRIPAEILRRFAHLISGMLLRFITFYLIEVENCRRPLLKNIQFLVIRSILIGEFFFAFYTGNLALWIA